MPTTINTPNESALIKVYTFFRLISATVLLSVSALHIFLTNHEQNISLHIILNLSYFFLCLFFSIFTITHNYQLSAKQTFFAILCDQAFLVYFIYANIHTSNNYDILLITPIGMAAILFRGTLATFFAASATLGLFTVHFYAALYEFKNIEDTERLTLFGFIFFSASLAIQWLSKKLRDAQKHVEESELHAQQLSILNSQIVSRIRTGIIIFDAEHRLILSNPAATNLLQGHSAPSAIRIEQDLKHWQLHAQQPQAQENIRYNFSELDDNGHIIAFIENLTEIAQQAQQLKLASLGRLTASIAHELRNPLSAVSFANQLLQNSDDLKNDDKELIATSEANVNRINRIISDILSVSKGTSSIPDRIDLVKFCKLLQYDFTQSHPHANILIISDEHDDFFVPFDSHQLRQILVNLIENGIRYSQAHINSSTVDKADLILKCEKLDNMAVSLNIIDKGAGVAKENHNNLFEPFFTTEKSGTGLGLYLSKELCSLNQAQLSYIETPEKKGACFNIRFSHPDRDILVKLNHSQL